MRRVMDLPAEERRRLGEEARRHVLAHYSFERVVGDWEALYTELVARSEGRRWRWGKGPV